MPMPHLIRIALSFLSPSGEVYILASSKSMAQSHSGKLYKLMDPKRYCRDACSLFRLSLIAFQRKPGAPRWSSYEIAFLQLINYPLIATQWNVTDRRILNQGDFKVKATTIATAICTAMLSQKLSHQMTTNSLCWNVFQQGQYYKTLKVIVATKVC